jgi:tetratricopeptide (TPR) repeat protein
MVAMAATLLLVAAAAAVASLLFVKPASAANPPPTDSLRLVAMATDVVPVGPAPGAVQITAVIQYELHSAPRASVVFLTFEDDSGTATASGNQGHVVQAGTGEVRISALYRPTPGTQTFTFFTGLFQDEATMLAWTATNPLSLAPAESRYEFALAMDARARGDHQKAEGHLARAASLSPETARLYYWRADSLVHLGRYDEAVADYTRALELQPGDRWSLVGRGVAQVWREDFQAAVADLNAVINGGQRDEVAAWALRARGLARAGLSLPNAAILDYTAYLALSPQAADAPQVQQWIDDLARQAR